MNQLLTQFVDGDMIVSWYFDGVEHTITYGCQELSTPCNSTAADEYGSCVRHSLECAGKFDK